MEDETHYHRVYWHTLGTPQTKDLLVYERPDGKEMGFTPRITDDGRYLTLTVWRGTDPQNRFYYREVDSADPFLRLLDAADANHRFIGNSGTLFYFHTTCAAPRGRVIAIDIQQPEQASWRELIAEKDSVLTSVLMINHQFVLTYLHDAHYQCCLS